MCTYYAFKIKKHGITQKTTNFDPSLDRWFENVTGFESTRLQLCDKKFSFNCCEFAIQGKKCCCPFNWSTIIGASTQADSGVWFSLK